VPTTIICPASESLLDRESFPIQDLD